MNNLVAKRMFTTQRMVKISILALLGTILTMLNIPVPGFPPFLKLDLGNIPALIGAMTMGPLAAVFIELIKNLIKFILDSGTGGVGELSNFIVGIGYIIPFGTIYKKMPNTKGFIIGATVGTIIMTIIGALSNYFIIIPMYALIMGGVDLIVDMSAVVNSNIKDLRTLILIGIIPFNIFKGIVISIVGYSLYNSLKSVLNRL